MTPSYWRMMLVWLLGVLGGFGVATGLHTPARPHADELRNRMFVTGANCSCEMVLRQCDACREAGNGE